MDRPVIRKIILAALVAAAPLGAAAHQMIVFASVDCETVTVEAKFSNGNAVQLADVRVLDGENVLLMTLPIGDDGTASIALSEVDHSGGLVVEVDTGSHENYWIVTPDDIARSCQS
jgi:nickel transport protein